MLTMITHLNSSSFFFFCSEYHTLKGIETIWSTYMYIEGAMKMMKDLKTIWFSFFFNRNIFCEKEKAPWGANRATDIWRTNIWKRYYICSARPQAFDVVAERALNVSSENSPGTLPLANFGILDKSFYFSDTNISHLQNEGKLYLCLLNSLKLANGDK